MVNKRPSTIDQQPLTRKAARKSRLFCVNRLVFSWTHFFSLCAKKFAVITVEKCYEISVCY